MAIESCNFFTSIDLRLNRHMWTVSTILDSAMLGGSDASQVERDFIENMNSLSLVIHKNPK